MKTSQTNYWEELKVKISKLKKSKNQKILMSLTN